jgi:hypothetical protein
MADGDTGADCTDDDAAVGCREDEGEDGAGVDDGGVDGVGTGELGVVTTCEKPAPSERVPIAQPPAPIPPTTTAAAVIAAAARRRRNTRDVWSARSSTSAT